MWALFAGVLFAVSAYGFFTRKNWAFLLSVIGIVLALLASWFINVPYMAAGLPPVYFPLFWPYLLIYFLLMRGVGGVSWSRTLLALLTGVAYIFCFMNGVSSTSRIITHGAPIFVLVQRLHFLAMIGWAVVTVGLIISPKSWMRVVGSGQRHDRTCGGHPAGLCHRAAVGALLPFCPGADCLFDASRHPGLAGTLGTLDADGMKLRHV